MYLLFHNALRKRYSVNAIARFSPLPSLDLNFLTEILVRGRRTVALNVACSIPPGKPEARYVRELLNLGYRVDLRERKCVMDATGTRHRTRGQVPGEPTSLSSSEEMSAAAAGPVRYEEDLVDEVLQTRISASVMEYFERQGTLVLATGDAQPAKLSDGFLAYAERALKMGWHVEVVSWRNSLSSHWRSLAWKTEWIGRFRIIELDDFIDDLLACSA